MDGAHFDRLVLSLSRARTRRSVLGLLRALGLTALVARDVAAQACLPNGSRCGAARGTCCSGRCVRKQGTRKKVCRQAPGQGTCTIEFESCGGPGAVCDEDRAGDCFCYVTTRGYSFCAASGVTCHDCKTNADCEQVNGWQPGDQCVQCSTCTNPVHNSRGCVHTCPNRATA